MFGPTIGSWPLLRHCHRAGRGGQRVGGGAAVVAEGAAPARGRDWKARAVRNTTAATKAPVQDHYCADVLGRC